MKSKRLMVTVNTDLYKHVEAMAEQEDRSLAGMIVRLASERVKQLQSEETTSISV